MRYLLEPLTEAVPGASAALKRLKALQELLGELHDAHVLEKVFESALGDAAAQRARTLLELALEAAPDPKRLQAERRRGREAGLLALATRNRQRRDQLFERLAEEWLGANSVGFFSAVATVEAAIAAELEAARLAALGTPPAVSATTTQPE